MKRTATVEFATQGDEKRYEVSGVICEGETLLDAERDAVRLSEALLRDDGYEGSLSLVCVATSPLN
jgi:hypothetical protein